MVKNAHTVISIAVLAVMALMVIAAIRDMRQSGSLDDLAPEDILKAVNDG
jgi:hypothetical protein